MNIALYFNNKRVYFVFPYPHNRHIDIAFIDCDIFKNIGKSTICNFTLLSKEYLNPKLYLLLF